MKTEKDFRDRIADIMYGENEKVELFKELSLKGRSQMIAQYFARVIPGFDTLPWIVSDCLLVIAAIGLAWAAIKFYKWLLVLYFGTKLFRFVKRNI